jgi:hypothetical protein
VESYWYAPLGSFVPTISPEQIQNIFDKKILFVMNTERSATKPGL